MSTKTTKIEWTDKTWNPITGCTKISQGCAHCYAEVMTRRLNAMGLPKYADGFKVSLHEDCLAEPLEWKQPHTIFVCSMSDIFHNDVPFDFVDKIMATLGELNLQNIDWVIVGGESGLSARPMKEEWVLSIKQQTELQGSAFFFKQWGTWGSDGVKRNKHKNGKLLKGRVFQAMPA